MLGNRKSRLHLESLESRQLMAGDVSAFAISKILYIKGDAASNGIALVSDGLGNINVVGLGQDGAATTINGGAGQAFTKIKDIVITMGKGDDAVAVSDIYVNGNLYIQGSQGNDFVGLGEFDTAGRIDAAVDALLGPLSVKKSVIVQTDDGDDTVVAQNATFNKSIVISTGLGNDTVELVAHGDPGDLDYVPGISVRKTLTVATGSGNDAVQLDRVSAKSLTVNLDNGDDTVSVEDITIAKKASFNGGSHADTYADLGGNSIGKKLNTKHFETLV